MRMRIGSLFAGLVAASALLVPVGASPAAAGTAWAPSEQTSRLDWQACAGENLPEGIRCATVTVPVDWKKPRGRKITLELARLPATDPANRIGSVLQVPGGPGAEGVEDLKRSAPGLTELRRRFDLVGYNPRNTRLRERLPAVCAETGPQLMEPRDREEYRAQAAALGQRIAGAGTRTPAACPVTSTPSPWPGTWRRSARRWASVG